LINTKLSEMNHFKQKLTFLVIFRMDIKLLRRGT